MTTTWRRPIQIALGQVDQRLDRRVERALAHRSQAASTLDALGRFCEDLIEAGPADRRGKNDLHATLRRKLSEHEDACRSMTDALARINDHQLFDPVRVALVDVDLEGLVGQP